jgi:hypothetical protein
MWRFTAHEAAHPHTATDMRVYWILLLDGVSVSDYLSAVETLVNVVFNFEPRAPTTVMIATEMPAAINPYSMAVAPDSSRMNR